MTNQLRVILDSNVFSRTHFGALRDSPFRLLCARGRVVPIYPNVVLEEVLQSYGSDFARAHLINEWLPLILETAGQMCDDLVSILQREIVQGQGPRASIYMRRHNERTVREQLRQLPLDGSWGLMSETQSEREEARTKRVRRKENAKAMRLEVARRARQAGLKITPDSVPAAFEPSKSELENSLAKVLLQKFVIACGWESYYRRWTLRKGYYPFFTQFVEDVVFQDLHFMTNPESRIDVNAQPDLEILAHLYHADLIVTNESSFMKTAFELRWRPKGKMLMTSEQFTRHLERL